MGVLNTKATVAVFVLVAQIVVMSSAQWVPFVQFSGTLPSYIYALNLNAGDKIRGLLTWTDSANLDIYLYRDRTDLLQTRLFAIKAAASTSKLLAQNLQFTVADSGKYYLRIDLLTGTSANYKLQIYVNSILINTYYQYLVKVSSYRTIKQFYTQSTACNTKILYTGPPYDILLYQPGANLNRAATKTIPKSSNPITFDYNLTRAGLWTIVINHGIRTTTAPSQYKLTILTELGARKCVNFCQTVPNTIGTVYGVDRRCVCKQGFIWDDTKKVCYLDCSKVLNSLGLAAGSLDQCQCRELFYFDPVTKTCQCKQKYKYNSVDRTCIVDCAQIAHAVESVDYICQCQKVYTFNAQTLECECLQPAIFDKQSDTCSCPGPLTYDSEGICSCLKPAVYNYELNMCSCGPPLAYDFQNNLCSCKKPNIYDQKTNTCTLVCLYPKIKVQQFCMCPAPWKNIGDTCICEKPWQVVNGECICQIPWVPVNGRCLCPYPMVLVFGQCRCPSPLNLIQGKCVCAAPRFVDADGICKCPKQSLEVSGKCLCINPWIGEYPNCKCPTPWSQLSGQCVCADPMVQINGQCKCANPLVQQNGECKCLPPNTLLQNNVCKVDCTKLQNGLKDVAGTINQCVCKPGYSWDKTQYKCVIDCTAIQYAISNVPYTANQCTCRKPYKFNIQDKKCEIYCVEQQTEAGTTLFCECPSPFVYVPELKTCIIDCTLVKFARRIVTGTTNMCRCINRYIFDSVTSQCVMDCGNIPYAKTNIGLIDSCICSNGFRWSSVHGTCLELLE